MVFRSFPAFLRDAVKCDLTWPLSRIAPHEEGFPTFGSGEWLSSRSQGCGGVLHPLITWRMGSPDLDAWLVTPIYKPWKGQMEGEQTDPLGTYLLTTGPWTTYPSRGTILQVVGMKTSYLQRKSFQVASRNFRQEQISDFVTNLCP